MYPAEVLFENWLYPMDKAELPAGFNSGQDYRAFLASLCTDPAPDADIRLEDERNPRLVLYKFQRISRTY